MTRSELRKLEWQNPEIRARRLLGRKGYKHSEETKKKIGLAQKGKPRPYQSKDKAGAWKGDNVSYSGLHKWIRTYKGQPKECEYCGESHNLQWANISHEYKRDLEDWINLCAKCHDYYDRKSEWGVIKEIYPGKNRSKERAFL